MTQPKKRIVISQRKYTLHILEETRLENCKSVDSPMHPNQKLTVDQGETFSDPERQKRLMGKLIHPNITRLNISFVHEESSHRSLECCNSHTQKIPRYKLLYKEKGNTQIIGYYAADLVGCPTNRRPNARYCVFIGGNIVSQNGRFRAQVKYRFMALATCELV